MLSIQTNVNSLVAQQNLSVNNAFQSKTIQQLTSGYRINSSGDDAAGLAVANKYRSGVAELTQGVANGNDGVAQLQIMDGGMNNIAQMLDRLKTLAMQSASGTFSGDRATLNSEVQTDLGEIDRQAQSIGLNTGGNFAKSLAVYLGSGSGSQSQTNAAVAVDLSKTTVDAQSLGLSRVQAMNGTAYNLGASSATSVATIVANAGNTTSAGGTADSTFYGPSFGDASGVKIAVNLTGVGDTASLVANINAAIQSAASQAGGNYAAFKAADITASIKTDSSGNQMLSFTSSSAARCRLASGLERRRPKHNHSLTVAAYPRPDTEGLSIIDFVLRIVSTAVSSPIAEFTMRWNMERAAGHSTPKYCLINAARSRSTLSASSMASASLFPLCRSRRTFSSNGA